MNKPEMNDERLDALLQEAKRRETATATFADLPGEVRQRFSKRRRTICSASVVVVLCAALTGAIGWRVHTHFREVAAAASEAAFQAKLAELQNRIDRLTEKMQKLQEEQAEYKEYQDALAVSEEAANRTPFGMKLRYKIQSEQLAHVFVGIGEDCLAQDDTEEAIRNFKKVVEIMPNTAAYKKAKEHLAKLGM